MDRRGHLFLMIGPSGSGKTTIIREVTARRPDVQFLPTTTTRPPRPGEKHGRDYFFMSEEEFDQAIARGDFLEWQVIHGYRYGTSRSRLDEAIQSGIFGIFAIDIFGGLEVKRIFGPDATTIFVRPHSTEEIRERLVARGDSKDDIETRMRRVEEELQMADKCDVIVYNDNGRFEEAVKTVIQIIDETMMRSGVGD